MWQEIQSGNGTRVVVVHVCVGGTSYQKEVLLTNVEFCLHVFLLKDVMCKSSAVNIRHKSMGVYGGCVCS